MKRWATLVLLTILFPLSAQAEKIEWNEYEIHYASFKSTLIPADVAEAHKIVRSDSRIVINISILKDGEPVAAGLEGSSRNLLGQIASLDFREVVEESAIYYLASQIVDERDTIVFDIGVSPVTSQSTYEFAFTRRYIAGSLE